MGNICESVVSGVTMGVAVSLPISAWRSLKLLAELWCIISQPQYIHAIPMTKSGIAMLSILAASCDLTNYLLSSTAAGAGIKLNLELFNNIPTAAQPFVAVAEIVFLAKYGQKIYETVTVVAQPIINTAVSVPVITLYNGASQLAGLCVSAVTAFHPNRPG